MFPAMYSGTAAQAAEAVADGGEASCFYHPENRAAVPCDSCGKFLCAVCDLDLDGRHLCHECLDRGIKTRTATIEDERILWDSMALHLTTWPVLTVYLPIFTAPIALYLVIRHWGQPPGILPRSSTRKILALVLAVIELAGLTALILWVIQVAQRARV